MAIKKKRTKKSQQVIISEEIEKVTLNKSYECQCTEKDDHVHRSIYTQTHNTYTPVQCMKRYCKKQKADKRRKKNKTEEETVSFIFMVNDHIEISIQFILFNFCCDILVNISHYYFHAGQRCTRIARNNKRECATLCSFSLDARFQSIYVITTEIIRY